MPCLLQSQPDTHSGLPATSLITHSKYVIAPNFLLIMVKYYHTD